MLRAEHTDHRCWVINKPSIQQECYSASLFSKTALGQSLWGGGCSAHRLESAGFTCGGLLSPHPVHPEILHLDMILSSLALAVEN